MGSTVSALLPIMSFSSCNPTFFSSCNYGGRKQGYIVCERGCWFKINEEELKILQDGLTKEGNEECKCGQNLYGILPTPAAP